MESDRHGGASELRRIEHALEAFVILQHLAATIHDAQQRLFRDMGEDAGLMTDQVAQARDQRCRDQQCRKPTPVGFVPGCV